MAFERMYLPCEASPSGVIALTMIFFVGSSLVMGQATRPAARQGVAGSIPVTAPAAPTTAPAGEARFGVQGLTPAELTPPAAPHRHDGPHRFCFVCDCSNSMEAKLPLLRSELKLAIGGLRPVYSFNIIVFQAGKPAALSDESILASRDNKDKADRFIDDLRPADKTDPIAGLRVAFAQHPDIIYLWPIAILRTTKQF